MRTVLDALYRWCNVLAAAFMAFIAVCVISQIIGRFFGVLIPGAHDVAGYSLSAFSFLALAYTLRTGGHIRVNLLIRRMPPPLRRVFELWCLAAGIFVSGYFAYFAGRLIWESYVFHNMAIGILRTPLWIPQIGMAVGVTVLFISFVDEFIGVLRGNSPSYWVTEAEDEAAIEGEPGREL